MKTLAATLITAALLAGCANVSQPPPMAADMPTHASDGTLVGPNGKTLYTFAKDGPNMGTSACYDQCATNWPPLMAVATAAPMGNYTIIVRSDNTRQWAFKGQPLYYFIKDTKAGDRTGDGLMSGNWKVAKP